MKILITGICGFVGSTLALELSRAGFVTNIIGIDNLGRPGSEINRRKLISQGIHVIHGDVRCASDVNSLSQVDWVVDAAANPSVLAGVDGKTSSLQLVEHNLTGTINLLEYCKRHQAGFVLLSTSRVYSIPSLSTLLVEARDNAYIPLVSQNFPLGISSDGVGESYSTAPPVSLYGSTKIASEHLALEYGSTFQFPVWVNRCGVLAGAGQFGHPAQGIFSYWIHSFRENSPLKYIGFGGNGYQVRDCLHPRDLISLLKKQFIEPLETDKPRVINVSGGIQNCMSLAQLTGWCNTHFSPMPIERTTEIRPFDIPWMVLDPTLARHTWNWHPTTQIQQILEEIHLFSMDNPDWLAISSLLL